MKLIILAAGKGTRLFPLTKNTPKSLIDLGDGTTMLERQLEGAIQCEELDEVIIVTGYKADQIEAKIKDYKSRIKLQTVYNPFFDVSNNLMSLWLAHYLMDEDFMITNGDNIYESHVFCTILDAARQSENTIQLTVDFKNDYDDDDMKVLLDGHGNLVQVSKKIPIKDVMAESVGLVLVKGSNSRKVFCRKLHAMVRDEASLSKFWLEIFNALLEDGYTVHTTEIDATSWREMDFHPDVNLIKLEIQKKLNWGSTSLAKSKGEN